MRRECGSEHAARLGITVGELPIMPGHNGALSSAKPAQKNCAAPLLLSIARRVQAIVQFILGKRLTVHCRMWISGKIYTCIFIQLIF